MRQIQQHPAALHVRNQSLTERGQPAAAVAMRGAASLIVAEVVEPQQTKASVKQLVQRAQRVLKRVRALHAQQACGEAATASTAALCRADLISRQTALAPHHVGVQRRDVAKEREGASASAFDGAHAGSLRAGHFVSCRMESTRAGGRAPDGERGL